MQFKTIVLLLVSFFSCTFAHAITITVNAGDIDELIDAINAINQLEGTHNIDIADLDGDTGNNDFFFDEGFNGTNNALPEITGKIKITRSIQDRVGFYSSNPDLRLATISGDGGLHIKESVIEGFSVMGNGGVFLVKDNSTLLIEAVLFTDNSATGDGGIAFAEDNSTVRVGLSSFTNSMAGNNGGALSFQNNASGSVALSYFEGGSAGVFGCQINYNSSKTVDIIGNTFKTDCSSVLIENPFGKIKLRSNTFAGESPIIDSTGDAIFFNNLISNAPNESTLKKNHLKDTKSSCNDFGTGAISSTGYNISTESSCQLTHSTDLQNTDPLINPPDENGVVVLQSNSPAIDSGPIELISNSSGFDSLPCSYKDSRGLGRPQDANNDGVFECDRGSYEVQGGANLTNAQSGLYFDVDRNGEGIILEMLSSTSALITMFTYAPNKTDLMWFIGVGNVIGNSVVIDNIQSTSGGVFGAGFDSSAIIKNDVGSLSVVFPDCNASENPGRMVFQSKSPFKESIENLLVKSSRLSRLLNCDQSQPNPQSGRSGAFYDPSRSGEGIFVQVLDDGSTVVIFYTYTPDGKQFWLISSDVQVTDNIISANMVYPASTTGFGSQFNASEIDLQPWGTLTLEYQTGCSQVNMAYASTVAGFGSGAHPYQRLTQPAGTTCDL